MNLKLKGTARLFLAGAAQIIFMACSHSESLTSQRQEILALHDSVMALSSPLVAQQIILDSLAGRKAKLPGVTALAVTRLKQQSDSLSESMDYWMQHFNADKGDKTDEEAAKYFGAEKKKVEALKAGYKSRIAANKNLLDSIARAEATKSGVKAK